MSDLLQFILDHEQPFKSPSRLASLYSDFSHLKTTNPDGYQANVAAWTSALAHASRAGLAPGTSVFCVRAGQELASELQTKSLGRPLALDEVLNDAVANKTVIPLRKYLDAERSIFEKRWIQFHMPSPWQVAKWGLRQIGLGGSQNRLVEGEFVIVANVQAACKALLSRLSAANHTTSTPTSLIYSLETFTDSFSDLLSTPTSSTTTPLSATDIQILLRYISRERQIATTSTDPATGTTTVKFAAPHSLSPPTPITPQDTTIATLHTLTLSLATQITALHTRIDALAVSARVALAANQRTMALTHLRAKKGLEGTLAKRTASAEQVQGVLGAIDEAAGQVEMVRALEAGGKVLKELNRRVGGVERVETVMEGLREEMEGVEDVGRVLAEGGTEGLGVDELEVDEEMEALEREVEEKRVRRERERLEALPSAPVGPVEEKESVEQEVGREKTAEKRLSAMSLDEPDHRSGDDRDRNEAHKEVIMS